MNTTYFSHARSALARGLPLLGAAPGSEILLPDYICSIVPDVLRAAGFVPRYYAVDDQLQPDWNSVRDATSPRACALLLVHYFGVASALPEAARFCAAHGLALIEDNAHGFGAVRDGKPLGTWGLFGITAPRKVLPIRNGGILYHATALPVQSAGVQIPPGRVCYAFRQAAKGVLAHLPGLARRLKRQPDYPNPLEGREAYRADQVFRPDPAASRAIKAADQAALRSQRQACWRVWQQWCLGKGLVPVFSVLHEGDSPLNFPVRVQDPRERAAWFQWGWSHAIDVHSWPALPDEVIATQGCGYRQWAQVLCFPIAPGMTVDRLREALNA